MKEISQETFEALLRLDTPTICNALEVVAPERRNHGFNVRPFVCARPQLEPRLAYARTVRIRAQNKPSRPQDSDGYYAYIAEGGPTPSVAVIHDMDDTPGFGAFWGEVNTNIHYGLDCQGVITDGSIRDIPDAHENFQMLAGMVNPSHSWVHVVDWGQPVNVHGMEVSHGDLVHFDMHGAVVVPDDAAEDLIEAAAKIMARERIVIEAARQPDFNMTRLREAWKGMAEIH